MSTGNQTIAFTYYSEAKSQVFNRVFYKTSFPGLLSGGVLTRVGDTEVSLAALACVIEDAAHSVGVRVDTTTAVSITTSTILPYIVLRFTWQNTTTNEMKFLAVAYGSILDDDIIIGKCIYTGSVLSAAFDYTRTEYSELLQLQGASDALKVTTTEPGSTSIYVQSGVALIDSIPVVYAGGSSAAFTFPVVTARTDLVTLSSAGAIVIVEGVDTAGAPVPDFPYEGLVLAKVTFPAAAATVLSAHISNYTFNKQVTASLASVVTLLNGYIGINQVTPTVPVDIIGAVKISSTLLQASLTRQTTSETLVDDAEVVISTGKSGFGFVQIGDNEEFAEFSFTAAGVVTLLQNSANVDNANTDTKLCIYDAGSGIAIRNRLGSSKTVRFALNYS